MFLESMLLSVCSLLVIYSTAGVRGGSVAGLRAKGAPRLGLCVPYTARFFTKPVLFYNKLVLSTTSASIQKAGRQKASIESPLIPTQPSSGPWDLVRGLVETIYARLSCRGCAYMAV